ncbi:hypothetical protein QJS10_CPA06g00745 [Acorus calamus]|uniref:Uncharacterized protein n=1 Tax=Acorus calamus TaxID=4465 RepID=A0AAV9ELW2_ACOCL|nr:hypothetical protein QJS10_CPA06g00745 [Acorus calamus]
MRCQPKGLRRDVSMVSSSVDKYFPLHDAASKGYSMVVAMIVRLEPRLAKMLNSKKVTALHVAVQNNRIDTINEINGAKGRVWMCE